MFTTSVQVQASTPAGDEVGQIVLNFWDGVWFAIRAGFFSGLVGPPLGLLLLMILALPSTVSDLRSSVELGQALETLSFVAAWGLLYMLPLMAGGALLGVIAGLLLGIPLSLAERLRRRYLLSGVWILAFGLFGLLFIPIALFISQGGSFSRYYLLYAAPFSGFGLLGGLMGSTIAIRVEASRTERKAPRPLFTPGKLLFFGSRGIGGRKRNQVGPGGDLLSGGGPDHEGLGDINHVDSLQHDAGLDARWLERWADLTAWSPAEPGKSGASDMAEDRYETVLCEAATPELLAAAGAELLRYRFYPPQVACALGQYDLEDRDARDGDRVLQRLRILRAFGLPVLDILSMVDVRGIEAGPESWTFGYVTTERHPGRGWWRVTLENDADQGLRLTMTASAAPAYGRISGLPGIRAVYRRLMRHYQGRAHRRGIAAFRARVQGLAESGQVVALAEAARRLDSGDVETAAKAVGPIDAPLGEDNS